MALKEQITADMIAAMKARDELKTSTLRMMKAEIMKYEVSGKDKVATDEVVLDIFKRAIKQRKDSAEAFTTGGKADMAQQELGEIKIIEAYMPAQMSEEEIRKIVADTIKQMNATVADFGKVMGMVVGKTKGKADGSLVSKVVKEMLK
ncbi:GatB/YqeY domain-containing protein [Candidatus Peregrinibacteria bacterium]|nr:GatB/YqeY domain-containing protein [Candidatus Peregrinibacteria bacterium]